MAEVTSYPVGKHRIETEFNPTHLYSEDIFASRKKKYAPIKVSIHIDLDKFFNDCQMQRDKHPRSNNFLPFLEFESEQYIPGGHFTFILPYKGTQVIFSDVRFQPKYRVIEGLHPYSAGNYQWVML